jgi:hypothetical protein
VLLHDLDGHEAAQGLVHRPVHRAHAARAHLLGQQEGAQHGRHLLLGAAMRAVDDGEGIQLGDVKNLAALAAGNAIHPVRQNSHWVLRHG